MKISKDSQQILERIAKRHDVSVEAVEHLLTAMTASGGTQAQFNHPELGGMGQWSGGGMIMVGDMFNNGLKAKVAAMCSEVAGLVSSGKVERDTSRRSQSQDQGYGETDRAAFRSAGDWWPQNLGPASSTGSQNDLHYAFFPESRRLAIKVGGRITLYDTKDHHIGGVSQQQSTGQSLSFTSQHGPVKVSDLEVVTWSK